MSAVAEASLPDSSDKPGRFFLPGPTEVSRAVLEAQARPMMGHRGKDIKELVRELQEGLQVALLTERPVFIGTSSGTGFMEAGVRNAASQRVLSLTNGAFSERFATIARACGLNVDTLSVEWGEGHDPQMVRERLGKGRYEAVTVCHSETSTGVLNPVADIARVVREHDDTLVLVDSVSGAAGTELRTDEWGLDWLLTGSQKAFALPPGLAFGVASERLLERSETLGAKGAYFDLLEYQRQMERFQTPTTPALTLLYSLQAQLRAMLEEGIQARWERHLGMARRCWEWVVHMREDCGVALEVLAPEGFRSPTVTCVSLPEGVGGTGIVDAMKERGFVIGAGYGRLKDTTIRIGHMGDHTMQELDTLLDVLGAVFGGLSSGR
ncbi:MAG: alanine--glyoxylate aminotransferase family protein [Gemmatimonadota bacterium]|nr:MAG: alanine--glyoxylate aminotransferase family protein [Gemmatimonadota bacterium]